MVGCFLAILVHDERSRFGLIRYSRILAFPALVVLLLCAYFQREEYLLFEQICIAALIAATTFHGNSFFARPLSFPLLTWLGTVSYSVYIWQGLFMDFQSAWAICFFMPLAALASYYFIERPFTGLGHALTSGPKGYSSVSSRYRGDPMVIEFRTVLDKDKS